MMTIAKRPQGRGGISESDLACSQPWHIFCCIFLIFANFAHFCLFLPILALFGLFWPIMGVFPSFPRKFVFFPQKYLSRTSVNAGF